MSAYTRAVLQLAVNSPDLPKLNAVSRCIEAAAVRANRELTPPLRFGKRAPVTVRIVGEREMSELNSRYRQRSGPTDILSFSSEYPPELRSVYGLGDIVLCAPVIVRKAAAKNKDIDGCWTHLLVHGTLHLLGFEHEQPELAIIMEALETEVLAELGYPDPYA